MTRKKNRRSGLSRKSPEEYDTNENIVLFGLAGKQWGGRQKRGAGGSIARQGNLAMRSKLALQINGLISIALAIVR